MNKLVKICMAALLVISQLSVAQEVELTREKVLSMSIEQLSALPLDQLMQAFDIVGVSSLEELYELLLNKDVTSASKMEESLFDSPLSTTVLSYDEIISSGATTIEEALRLVPGVIVREKTNGNYDVHIRGNDNLPSKNMMLYSENMNTLVMINGRPVFNYSHGGTLWETLPVGFEDIDRIEVVRGPSSALYGPNALSGVINIITKQIDETTPLLSANVQGGSLSTYLGDLAFRKKFNKAISAGVTGNYETRKRNQDEILIYNGENADGTPAYTLDGNAVGTGYYSLAEIEKMQKFGKDIWPPYNVGDQVYDVHTSFPNPGQSKERFGINGYLDISPNYFTNIHLSAGYQNSEALTSSMGDMPSPYATKISETKYVDLRATVKGLTLQANYNGGTIDYMAGNEGFELDNQVLSAQAEYNFQLGKLSIRPGVSYQSMSYDDTEHISEVGKGYLNQKRTINILAGSLRLDYSPTDKIRLVAAMRAEDYNHPDDIYPSWQFVGSYKINENNLFRAVYSRANQSAFLVNTYSNYTWTIVNRPYPRVIQFDGDNNHDLKTMDMFEIGYRTRPSKNVLIDLEAFYATAKGYGVLQPDYTDYAIYNPLGAIMGQPAIARPDSVHIQYHNLDLTSAQIGASVSVDWVINEKLVANAHFTVQQTKLDNYQPISRDDIILHQATEAGGQAQAILIDYGTKLALGQITPGDIPSIVKGTSTTFPSTVENDYTHKATPSYFGGFSLTYRPTKKWEIFPQAYFYGEQTFVNQYHTEVVDAKFLMNAKIAYKASSKLTLFANGRNIFNSKSREFAFMDEIGGLYLLGLNFRL